MYLHRPSRTPSCRQRCSPTIALAKLPITGLGDSRKSLVSQSLDLFAICMGSFPCITRSSVTSEPNPISGVGSLYLHYYCPFDFTFHSPCYASLRIAISRLSSSQNGSYQHGTAYDLLRLFTCKLSQNFRSYDSFAV